MKKIFIYIVIIAVIALAGVLAWRFWPKAELEEPLSDWEIYRNEEYRFEMRYPKDWSYTVLAMPFNPIIFAPSDKISELEQLGLHGTMQDDLFTLMTVVYDKIFFEEEFLPYILGDRVSGEWVETTPSSIDMGGIEATYYLSEYKDFNTGQKTGEKSVRVIVKIDNGYLSMMLIDYQYLGVFENILSTFELLD